MADFAKAFFGLYKSGFHTLKNFLFVDRLLVTLVFTMPQVIHLRRQKSVFTLDALVAKAQDKVSIFVTPPFKGLIKSIDGSKIMAPDSEIAAADSVPLEALFYPE